MKHVCIAGLLLTLRFHSSPVSPTCEPDEILQEEENGSQANDPPGHCASNAGGDQGMPRLQQVLRPSGSGFQRAGDQSLFASPTKYT